MAITEFDLYKSEWLELVFDDRNHAYGAYDLRKHYAGNLTKAMGATFLAVICLFMGFSFYLTRKPLPPPEIITEFNPNVIVPPTAKPPVTPPKPVVEPPAQHASVRFPPPVVAPDQVAIEVPTVDQISHATVSQQNSTGDDIGNLIEPVATGNGKADVTEDKSIHTMDAIEIMPQFPGGEAALAKFLQKNLRYPPQATDAGIGGKVYMSFVVEKDGTISNITVERGVGYGLDRKQPAC